MAGRINQLRREAAKFRRQPNAILSIKLRMWREAKAAIERGYYRSALMGVYEERTSPNWINGSTHV